MRANIKRLICRVMAAILLIAVCLPGISAQAKGTSVGLTEDFNDNVLSGGLRMQITS